MLYVGLGELLSSRDSYRRLVEKLNYLTIIRPDIAFAVSVVSQFLRGLVRRLSTKLWLIRYVILWG